MSDERFNQLLDELIGGMPVTIVVARLTLLVKAMVNADADCSSGENVLERFVEEHRR